MRFGFGPDKVEKASRSRRAMSTPRPRRCAGLLRRHRRPRVQEDLPGVSGAGAPRQARLPVIGFGRSGWTAEQLIERAKASVTENGGYDRSLLRCSRAPRVRRLADYKRSALLREDSPGVWRSGSAAVRTLPGDSRRACFPAGRQEPARAELHDERRVIVEKPFGATLESAQGPSTARCTRRSRKSASSHRPLPGQRKRCRTSCTSLRQRLSRADLEPHYVESVQITMAESFGVKGRGKFTKETGRVRDVIQNHCCQIVSYLAHGGALGTYAEAIRDEQAKVLRTVRPLSPEHLVRRPVPRLSRRARGRQGLAASHLRRAAAVRGLLALGGRALPGARRQEAWRRRTPR
jgi:hypothetical protein